MTPKKLLATGVSASKAQPIKRASKKEEAYLRKLLRYMDPKNIARDFKSPEAKAAIAAVFEWIGYNGIAAEALKRPGHYNVNVPRNFNTANFNHVLIEEEPYERARKVLGLDKKPRKAGAKAK